MEVTIWRAIETLCGAEEADLRAEMREMGTVERVQYLRALREALAVMSDEGNRITSEQVREMADRKQAKQAV